MNVKKLYRSRDNRIITGLFGGLGLYTNTDPSVLRLIFLLFVVFTGFFPGVFLYIIASLIVPAKNNQK